LRRPEENPGIVAQAADQAVARGAAYFTARHSFCMHMISMQAAALILCKRST
jgi:hypothetical protein